MAGALNVALTLGDSRPMFFHVRPFLVLTFLLGLALADVGVLLPIPPTVFALGLTAHIVARAGGWLTLKAMGVSYNLPSMFFRLPENCGWLNKAPPWERGTLGREHTRTLQRLGSSFGGSYEGARQP